MAEKLLQLQLLEEMKQRVSNQLMQNIKDVRYKH